MPSLRTALSSVLLGVSSLAASALVDPDATDATRELLSTLREGGIRFGHQNTLAYGHNWIAKPGQARSDVAEVSGQFPVVFGWDLMDLAEEAPPGEDAYGLDAASLTALCQQAHAMGGINTFSWHARNPATGGSFHDKTPSAHELLPGGAHHAAFCAQLDEIAAFFKGLEPIPVIFRPWHEHNGDWFWWGRGNVSEENYVQLWRFTVEYLRDTKGVHNLLYAFSPDRSRMNLNQAVREYFYAYPGDAYVDIFGFDNYWDVGHSVNTSPAHEQQAIFIACLELVVRLADAHGKVAALTETGFDTLSEPEWYTQRLLPALDASETTRRLAYVMVWRNANARAEGREHFYVPYPGHPAEEDFRRFVDSPLIQTLNPPEAE